MALFFFWLSYSSPVNEAGRAFRKDVNSYQNVEIETMDDVFERLDMLDSHYNSATFDKVQGGERREVTRSDIETLFGEPHEVIEEVDMSSADTVYQYYYDDLTLNFHQRHRTIDEYVIEHFTETFYDSNTLDQLFIEAIINHQSQYSKVNEQFEPIMENSVPQLIANKTSTRNIRQSGWFTWSYNRQDYFDTGDGDYAPNEFLSLEFEEEDATELRIMERHYHTPHLETSTPEEMEKKKEAKYTFSDFFDQKESDNLDETLKVADFSNAFGEMTRIYYDFRKGILGVSWIMDDGNYAEEIMATVPVTDAEDISEISDLAELEVADFSTQLIFDSDRSSNNNTFIGSH